MIKALKNLFLFCTVLTCAATFLWGQDKEISVQTLSPRSVLASNPLTQENFLIQEALWKSSFFSEKERDALMELKSLALLFNLAIPKTDEEARNIFLEFQKKHGIALMANLSLYNQIEQLYNDYDKVDQYSVFLYSILLGIGMSMPVYDLQATGIAENFTIYRETRKNRLQNTLPLITKHLESFGKQPLIYDLGASFGTESLSLYEQLPTHKSGLKARVVMSDINIHQSVVYDEASGNKIYFNALNQAIMVIYPNGTYAYRGDPESSFSLFREMENKFQAVLKEKSMNQGKRFLKKDHLLVETVSMADPGIKFYQKLGTMQILQHDVKNPFPVGAEAPNAIRICNLLQYFELPSKIRIIRNLLQFLAPEGILVFNFNETTEDSRHLIVLKKHADGKIELLAPAEYLKSVNRTNPGFFTRLRETFKYELGDIRELLLTLNENPSENLVSALKPQQAFLSAA